MGKTISNGMPEADSFRANVNAHESVLAERP